MKVNSEFLSNNFIKPSIGASEVKEKNSLFESTLDSISAQENMVAKMKTEYLNGERDDIQNILVEGQKLNLEINFALQVRNNLVNMFQQLQSMQI